MHQRFARWTLLQVATALTAGTLSCVLPAPAAVARALPPPGAASAAALAAVDVQLARHDYAAAESLLRALPAPPADSAAVLDAPQLRLETVRLEARCFAPGMCDTTWLWRPARLIAALERGHARPEALVRAWSARARVEFRLGALPRSRVSAQRAVALAASTRVRDPLVPLRAHLALAEACADVDPMCAVEAQLPLDSLAALAGERAAWDRSRWYRIAGSVAATQERMAPACSLLRIGIAEGERQRPPNHAEVGTCLQLLGLCESYQDPVQGERDRLEAVRRLETTLGMDDERTLSVIAWSAVNPRDPAALPAVFAKLQGVHEYMRAHGLSEAAVAWDVEIFLSRFAAELHRYEMAEALCKHAIEVARRWLGPVSVRELITWNDLGILYTTLDRLDEAEQAYRRCVELCRGLPRTWGIGDCESGVNLTYVLAKRGKFAEARELLRHEFATKDYTAWDPALFAEYELDVGSLSRALSDTLDADSAYRVGMEHLGRKTMEREALARGEEEYAAHLFWRGRDAEAVELAARTARVRREVIEETVPWLEDADALSFGSTRRRGLDILLSVLMSARGDDGWARGARASGLRELAGGRGLLLESLLRRVRGSARDAGSAAADLAGLRRELAASVLSAFRDEEAPGAAARRDTLRARIRARDAGDRTVSSAPGEERLSLAALALRLRGGALVSYARFQRYDPADAVGHYPWPTLDWYGAFVLAAGDSVPAFVSLGAADSLERAVSDWRQALAGGGRFGAGARAAGERLRRIAWDPVAARLAGARQVYVVPDGALQLVNLAALPVGRERFLIEQDLLLHRLGREQDLLRAEGDPGRGHTALALGAIDYDRAAGPALAAAKQRGLPGCRAFTEGRYAPLAGSGEEVGAIAAALGSPRGARAAWELTLLRGAEATESAFKRLAPGRRVVHLATHGFFLDPGCADDSTQGDVVRRNPLVFSGLVLAGANDWRGARNRGEEDGLLTAEELAGMDLHAAEWLVFSGCESGLGQLQASEGVYGLPRAARQAGAGTVIMSLGNVDDDATRYWMAQLYRARFDRGLGTAEAVSEASRATLALSRRLGAGDDPRRWGAFVAVGE